MVHADVIPALLSEHVDSTWFRTICDGKFMTIYEPTISLFTVVNHKL